MVGEQHLAHDLLQAQIAIASRCLRVGGFAYFKLIGVSTTTQPFIAELQRHFREVLLARLATTRPNSLEAHLVCIDFRHDSFTPSPDHSANFVSSFVCDVISAHLRYRNCFFDTVLQRPPTRFDTEFLNQFRNTQPPLALPIRERPPASVTTASSSSSGGSSVDTSTFQHRSIASIKSRNCVFVNFTTTLMPLTGINYAINRMFPDYFHEDAERDFVIAVDLAETTIRPSSLTPSATSPSPTLSPPSSRRKSAPHA